MPSRLKSLDRDKRGFSISYKEMMWIPRLLFTVVVISLTLFIIAAFIVNKTNVAAVEASLLVNLAHYSPQGIAAADGDRTYPGLVEESKFSQSRIEGLFAHERPLIVGRLAKNQTIIGYELHKGDAAMIYTDDAGQQRYQRWQPIAQVRGRGEGGKTPYSEMRYVATAGGGAIIQSVFIASN